MCWPLSSVWSSRSTLRARPPSTRPASNSVVAMPPAVSSTAAAMPAQPPPMTAIFKVSALEPGFCRKPKLARRRQRNALVQDLKILAPDLIEERAVNRCNDQPGALVLAVNSRQLGKGLLVVFFGPLILELHQRRKVVRILSVQDVGGRDIELLQLVHRDIDAATPGILADVADDVGELEGHAQIVGVFLRLAVLVAKDFGSKQADHTGDTVAIERQPLEIEIARLLEVHLHAVDDFQQLLF